MTLFMVNSAEWIIIPEGYLALSNIGLRLYVQRTENMWSKYTT